MWSENASSLGKSEEINFVPVEITIEYDGFQNVRVANPPLRRLLQDFQKADKERLRFLVIEVGCLVAGFICFDVVHNFPQSISSCDYERFRLM